MIRSTQKLATALLLVWAVNPAWAALSEQQLAWHWDATTRDTAREATLALAIWLESESGDSRYWQDRVEANRLALIAAAERVPANQAPLADGLFAWLMQSRDLDLRVESLELALPDTEDLVSLLRPERQAGRLARMQHLMAFHAPEIWSRLRQRLVDASAPDPADEASGGPETQAEGQGEPPVETAVDIDAQIEAYWQRLMTPPVLQAELHGDSPLEHPETELAEIDAQASARTDPSVPVAATATISDAAGNAAGGGIQADQPLEPPEPSDAARRQAARVLEWSESTQPEDARRILIAIVLDEVEMAWSDHQRLAALWELLHALAETAALLEPQSLAADIRVMIEGFSSDPGRELRQIDTDLPVVLALLEDAAVELEAASADPAAALSLLGDAYARLALFADDAEFYLDQPVRDDIRSVVASCAVEPTLIGPLPRSVYEDCLELLVSQMGDALGRVELVGDDSGPFSDVFLRREMSLVSWQRVAYLDGHLNWLLGASCSPPDWQNPLEWSLLAHYLSRWVAQRPVFFDSPRWRDAVDAFERQAAAQREASILFIDCLSGLGSERQDPVLRLINRHAQALNELEQAVQAADDAFYAEATRPLADIDLDSDAAQLTSYRPEGLTIGPCPDANVCGVRTELPVSRALLSEFPNAFLLADQLKIGQLDLCYQDIRWEDRRTRPTRSNDPRVANYDGLLSFDLLGTFERAGQTEIVFRQRLRADQPRHYLFASSAPEVLEMECPDAIAGQPIASQLPEHHIGLVPDRLTYFVSQPTSAEAELLANWDQGAEWRDWFVTGERVEKIAVSDGLELAVEVEAELDRLVHQRERQLASRLLSRLNPAQTTPDPLSMAMAAVAENTALLRRVLEIHYPRVIRHEQIIRAALTGEGGLLNRDRVRQLADSEMALRDAADLGRERLARLRERWMSLPTDLRESGQVSPELDFAAERLADLRRLSRSWLAPVESSPDP